MQTATSDTHRHVSWASFFAAAIVIAEIALVSWLYMRVLYIPCPEGVSAAVCRIGGGWLHRLLALLALMGVFWIVRPSAFHLFRTARLSASGLVLNLVGLLVVLFPWMLLNGDYSFQTLAIAPPNPHKTEAMANV